MGRGLKVLNVCLLRLLGKPLLILILPKGQSPGSQDIFFFMSIKVAENHKLPFKWDHWHNYPFPSAPSLGPATTPSYWLAKQDLKSQCRVTMFGLGHGVGHLFWIASYIWSKETQAEIVVRSVMLFLGNTVLEITSPADPAASKTAILKAILLTFTKKLNRNQPAVTEFTYFY